MAAKKIDTTGWSEAQLARLAELQGRLDEEAQKRATLDAQDELKRTSPEAQLEAMQAKLEEEARANALREWEAAADVAYRKACREYDADRVGRITTTVGSIIFRSMTGDEFKEAADRTHNLPASDREQIARDEIGKLILYPSPEKFQDLTERFPGLWGVIVDANTSLATANAELAAKKG